MKKASIFCIIWVLCLVYITSYFTLVTKVSANNQTPLHTAGVDYVLQWPGILPDNIMLYKLKVLRNKIIGRMIVSPVKKVEFNLLMADKTIYASKLLVDKGEIALAKDTVLKGEHYYSMLVQDYNKALQQRKKIPESLDKKITLAAKKHQKMFKELENKVEGKDKETFQIVTKFSKINYDFIVGLRNPK